MTTRRLNAVVKSIATPLQGAPLNTDSLSTYDVERKMVLTEVPCDENYLGPTYPAAGHR